MSEITVAMRLTMDELQTLYCSLIAARHTAISEQELEQLDELKRKIKEGIGDIAASPIR